MSEHVREHRSVLAAVEKRLLIRIAGHLPPSIHSDHLTVLAFACDGAGRDRLRWRAGTPTGSGSSSPPGLNWFGDSLDGTVARVRQSNGRATASTSTTSSTSSASRF